MKNPIENFVLCVEKVPVHYTKNGERFRSKDLQGKKISTVNFKLESEDEIILLTTKEVEVLISLGLIPSPNMKIIPG